MKFSTVSSSLETDCLTKPLHPFLRRLLFSQEVKRTFHRAITFPPKRSVIFLEEDSFLLPLEPNILLNQILPAAHVQNCISLLSCREYPAGFLCMWLSLHGAWSSFSRLTSGSSVVHGRKSKATIFSVVLL